MEERTLNALDSANPFQTPIRPPASLDGRPVASVEVKPPAAKMPVEPPVEDPNIDVATEDGDTERTPEPAEFKRKRGRPAKAALEDVPAEVPIEPEENPITQSHDKNGMPSYRCEFAGRDIFIGKCVHRTINVVTSDAINAMLQDFGKDRIRTDTVLGDAMIYHARNIMAQRFLETDSKWLFFIDDDIVPSIGRAAWFRSWFPSEAKTPDEPLQRHLLHRLIGSGKTLIGGAYFGRRDGSGLMCSDQSLASHARAYSDKIAPVDWVGTGAMMIHRRVFDDIREKFPELAPMQAGQPFDYFRPLGHPKGEDVSFCERAKKAGHQCFIDLGTPVKHVGFKAY